MDPNETLSLFDSENKAESPITLHQLMEQLGEKRKTKSKSKTNFVIISLLAISINIIGIAMLMSSEVKNESTSSNQENEWQNVYSSLLINQKPN